MVAIVGCMNCPHPAHRGLCGVKYPHHCFCSQSRGYAGKGPECEYCEREAVESIGNVIVCEAHFISERPDEGATQDLDLCPCERCTTPF